jgi:hypothetical protein
MEHDHVEAMPSLWSSLNNKGPAGHKTNGALVILVARGRIELSTHGFSVRSAKRIHCGFSRGATLQKQRNLRILRFMKALFVELPAFNRFRPDYLDDEGLRALQNTLMEHPEAGDVI